MRHPKQEWCDLLKNDDVGLSLPSSPAGLASGSDPPTERHSLWNMLIGWLRRNTFAPDFLPRPLQPRAIGYLIAILLQGLMVTMMALLLTAFPNFSFPESLILLAILLVALGWGAGPSIVTTLVGGLLILLFLLPSSFLPSSLSHAVAQEENQFGVCLYLVVGLIISVLAGQTQRARYQAEALSKRLGDLLDAIPEPVVLYDRHGKSIQRNLMARVGAAGEQHTPLPDMPQTLKLLSVEGEPLSLELLPPTRALQGETVHNFEMSYTAPTDKREHFISVSAAPLRSLGRQDIESAVTVTRDLSALRLAERQAAERAQQLEAIFEAMTDGVFILKERGTPPQCNRAAWELLGFSQASPQEISVRLPFQFLQEDRSPLPADQWPDKRIRDGEHLQGETAMDVLMRTQNGQTLSLSITGGALCNARGQISGCVLVCRNVTERRSLERRVQQALDALLHMAQVIVHAPDADENREEQTRRITNTIAQQVAEQARQVLGCQYLSLNGIEPGTETLSPLAVVGRIPEEEQAWWVSMEHHPGSLAASLGPTVAERLRRNEIVVLDNSQPPCNEQPNPLHLRSVLIAPICFHTQHLGLLIFDYEEREHPCMQHDLAMTQAITQLIALVMERERLLTQRAEAQATLLAVDETNRLMDEFIGIAGHELRTPLTTVMISLPLARRQLKRVLGPEQLKEEQRTQILLAIDDLLGRTEHQVGRQNRLVNDLLDVSRLHADRLELHLDLCDLARLLEEVIEEQRTLTPMRTIHLERATQGEILVMADADRLRQVITNYLSNALKYSAAEQEVTAYLEIQGMQVRLCVQDHGPGLTQEQHQRIWERFYRVPGIKVKNGSGIGLGLGLHISRMMIERQGGKVGVQSRPGKGSTFWFTLPLAEHHQAQDARSSNQVQGRHAEE